MLRPKLNRLWGNSNAIVRRDPGDAKYIQGWLSEIPTYQVLNYLQWKTDATFLALAERGVFEWGAEVAYLKGAATWDSNDGAIYVAQLNNPNTTLAPSRNADQWKKSAIQITRKSYDDAVEAITAHIADVTGNPHRLTPGRLGTYTVAQINSLVAQYRADVQSHRQDKNNPHGTKAADIGAVPVTGGTYTGNVEMQTGQVLLDSAGVRKIRADETGVFMANASGQIGVDAAGKGFVKTGTLPSSTIVTASTFAENKAVAEPSYAVPQPILYLPLSSDLNLYQGSGVVNYVYSGTGSTPEWNPSVLDGLVIGPNADFEQKVVYDAMLEGSAEATIAIDVKLPAVKQNSPDAELYYSFGSSGACLVLEFHFDNTAKAWSSSGKTANIALKAERWNRVAVVYTATQMKIYVNGVLAASQSSTNTKISGNDFNFIRAAQQGAGLRSIAVRNIRAWAVGLSDKQVSTL